MFYKEILSRLDKVYNSLYNCAEDHFKKRYKIDENLYMLAINNNIDYIKKIIKDNSSNFRTKLRRGNLQEKEKALNLQNYSFFPSTRK